MISHPLSGGVAIDVAIIGGGPAGLAAATALKNRSVARVAVLEREAQAGGIPRHCGHPPFGMREFKRMLRGPDYAARLVVRAVKAGVEIHTLTTVIEARQGGVLLVAVPTGLIELSARRVIYATGVRETPRSARLISGARVQGVMNTGALQSMVFLKHRRPFKRPVIIGTELVAFSAIMTCRHAGIRPVAMIEAADRVTARWPSGLFPMLNRIPLKKNTRLESIVGEKSVTAVQVVGSDGVRRSIDCDGVILCGQFTPESTLARCGHLAVDPATGGPVVDQYGRCSDPAYFATGNLLRPVETAGWSWNEGRLTGICVASDLAGGLPVQQCELKIIASDPLIKYAMPQKFTLPQGATGMDSLQLRVSRSVKGDLVAHNGGGTVWRKRIAAHPERRILLPFDELLKNNPNGTLELKIEEQLN